MIGRLNEFCTNYSKGKVGAACDIYMDKAILFLHGEDPIVGKAGKATLQMKVFKRDIKNFIPFNFYPLAWFVF